MTGFVTLRRLLVGSYITLRNKSYNKVIQKKYFFTVILIEVFQNWYGFKKYSSRCSILCEIL